MSIATPERTNAVEAADTDLWVTESPHQPPPDSVEVTCATCNTLQRASGRALGYSCATCGSAWRVLRCRGCRAATIVLDGITTCPRCGHEHHATGNPSSARVPAWLVQPEPLSVWLGGVKYLGGHAGREQPIAVAGLLLDRRGIHLRAFSELFSIHWDRVESIGIEGPIEISERMTTQRLAALGASTWAMTVGYLTVRTPDGDAVFEVNGLGPPQLHARLSRVLQGLQRRDTPPDPIPLDRGEPIIAAPTPARETVDVSDPSVPPVAAPHTPIDIDPEHSDAPLEVLVVDALWKLAQLRDSEVVDRAEFDHLRARLLERVTELPVTSSGPLLHV